MLDFLWETQRPSGEDWLQRQRQTCLAPDMKLDRCPEELLCKSGGKCLHFPNISEEKRMLNNQYFFLIDLLMFGFY